MKIEGSLFYFLIEIICCDMRGHNIAFCAELTKIIPNYHQVFSLI